VKDGPAGGHGDQQDHARPEQRPEEQAAALGGRQVALYFTMGGYDVVGIYEMPDDEAMTRLALETASHGNTRTTILKAFPREEFVRIVQSLG